MLSATEMDKGIYVAYNVTGPVRIRVFSQHSPAGDVNGIPPPPLVTAVFIDEAEKDLY